MIVRPASGIPQYEPTDIIGSADTVDETLNILADATNDSIIDDRARLTTLENRMNAADLAAITIAAFADLNTAQGWAYRPGETQIVRAIGTRVEFSLVFDKSSTIAHGNYPIQIKPAYSQIANTSWVLNVLLQTNASSTQGGTGNLNPLGRTTVLNPPSNVNGCIISGFYHRV